MSKRRLSEQQVSRIARQQSKLKQATLKSESDKPDPTESVPNEQYRGIVVSHYGQQLDVESLEPSSLGEVIRCHQRSNLPALVTGDQVAWQTSDGESAVVTALGDRRSLFGRPSATSTLRPVAANVDVVLVVIAPLPEPFMNLIDRYLVAIESLNLRAILVLNKLDIAAESQDIAKMLSMYSEIGYQTLSVSAKTASGMAELKASLFGQTSVLVGQSGVGKSSLINSLALNSQAVIGPMSAGKAKGTHTTTTAKLYHGEGFDLIDSPGIREFGLGQTSPEQVFDGFIEFADLKGQCKFRDCAHRSEPGCVILAAAADGQIFQQRLDSYFQILGSLES